MNTKGISSAIAIVILVAITVIIAMGTFFFIDSYSKSQVEQIENPDLIRDSQLRYIYFQNDNITLFNPYDNLEIRDVLISGNNCTSTPFNQTRGPFQINISPCGSFNNKELILETDIGVFRVEINTR